jgi:hypothetical protein
MRAMPINHQRHALRLDGCSEFRELPRSIQPCSCAIRSNLIGILPASEINTMHSHDHHLLSRNSNGPFVRWPSHGRSPLNAITGQRQSIPISLVCGAAFPKRFAPGVVRVPVEVMVALNPLHRL